ncbi:MAG: hypothetical protein HY842_09105 [Bacteroidetes bacterium]|nr:hypothetical protein [Bacteroidota bacterium]
MKNSIGFQTNAHDKMIQSWAALNSTNSIKWLPKKIKRGLGKYELALEITTTHGAAHRQNRTDQLCV